MLSRSAQEGENKITWLPDETEEDRQIQWLKPQPSRLQSTLDYAKQLSERVFSGLKSVSSATSYLPHHMKEGATQAYDYAQEIYTQLKPVSCLYTVKRKVHCIIVLFFRYKPHLISQRKLWIVSLKSWTHNLDIFMDLEPT